MPVRIPTHTWLFNNDIRTLAEEGRSDISYHPETQAELQRIMDEYKKLEFFEDAADVTNPLIGSNVSISGYVELIAKPKDPDKLKQLLIEVHHAVRNRWVPADIYRRIGQCFGDMDANIEDEELKTAVGIATALTDYGYDERRSRFRAEFEVQRHIARGKERV